MAGGNKLKKKIKRWFEKKKKKDASTSNPEEDDNNSSTCKGNSPSISKATSSSSSSSFSVSSLSPNHLLKPSEFSNNHTEEKEKEIERNSSPPQNQYHYPQPSYILDQGGYSYPNAAFQYPFEYNESSSSVFDPIQTHSSNPDYARGYNQTSNNFYEQPPYPQQYVSPSSPNIPYGHPDDDNDNQGSYCTIV